MANMPSYAETTEMQFDAYVKNSIKNERKNFLRDLGRQREKQPLFSELDDALLLGLEDEYARKAFAEVDSEFQVLQYSVAVNDSLLYDALYFIDEQARGIILMAYWLEMTDQEIADETGLKRRTVNNIRNKTYQRLRAILEADGYDAKSFFPKSEP
jgi:RNA polymerase sigma factor (sigma-70 family)